MINFATSQNIKRCRKTINLEVSRFTPPMSGCMRAKSIDTFLMWPKLNIYISNWHFLINNLMNKNGLQILI